MKSVKIAVFASGSGSNCENLIKYFSNKECARVVLVVCNKRDTLVLERAARLGVPSVVVPRGELAKPEVMLPLMKSTSWCWRASCRWCPPISSMPSPAGW